MKHPIRRFVFLGIALALSFAFARGASAQDASATIAVAECQDVVSVVTLLEDSLLLLDSVGSPSTATTDGWVFLTAKADASDAKPLSFKVDGTVTELQVSALDGEKDNSFAARAAEAINDDAKVRESSIHALQVLPGTVVVAHSKGSKIEVSSEGSGFEAAPVPSMYVRDFHHLVDLMTRLREAQRISQKLASLAPDDRKKDYAEIGAMLQGAADETALALTVGGSTQKVAEYLKATSDMLTTAIGSSEAVTCSLCETASQ